MFQSIRARFQQTLTRRRNARARKQRQHSFTTSPVELEDILHDKYFVEIPISRCRSCYSGHHLDRSPFALTLRDFISGRCNSYHGSQLEAYYRRYRPSSMAEVFALESDTLADIHPMASVLPWWSLDPAAFLKLVAYDPGATRPIAHEAVKLGIDASSNYGWQFFGPVSEQLGELEFKRLTSTCDNIRNNGFNYRKAVGVSGEFLVSGQEWAWIGLGGKHRMASLAALGQEPIPVTTKAKYGPHITHRESAADWPNVKNGLFTRSQALQVFDTIMQGRTSPL